MKLAVVGSRSFEPFALADKIKKHIEENFVFSCQIEIVSGGALGADKAAEIFAVSEGLKFTCIIPEYEKYGRAAPHIRNKKIAEYADAVLAFHDGKSKGTLNTLDLFRRLGKKCVLIIL